MATHTPGPWGFTYDGSSDWSIGPAEDPQARRVAHVWCPRSQDVPPDVFLIAAAPELLEALIVAKGTLEIACGTSAPYIKVALTIIDAAIAKAEGAASGLGTDLNACTCRLVRDGQYPTYAIHPNCPVHGQRDDAPRFSERKMFTPRDLDAQTKPLHAEIERLRALLPCTCHFVADGNRRTNPDCTVHGDARL